MRVGLMLGATPGHNAVQAIIDSAVQAEKDGFDNVWMAHVFGHDAITALAVAAGATQRIGLGTAVVPTFPRHPTVMAQQALTAAAASNGRFTLGIGLSHKWVIDDMLGLSYDKPASHMQDYLSVLRPLLQGEAVDSEGSYRVKAAYNVDDPQAVPLVIAALGPRMLRIAGEMSDGTTTWMTGLNTLEQHIIPSISKAAQDAGRTTPRVVAGLPIVITDKPDAAKAKIAETLAIYGSLPSYQAMLAREGAEGPADIALVGDENTVAASIQRLRDMGVSDLNAAIMSVDDEAYSRTYTFLKSQL